MRIMSASPAAARGPGRPREFDVDAALDGAIAVFSEHGYHATSLPRLTEAMGIAEGSLYKAFRDKRAVFLAAFERYVARRAERLEAALAGARTGREKVRAMLGLYAEMSHGQAGRRGCLVVGSAVDLASTDSAMAKRVTAVLASHEKRLVGCIREGQADGSIAPGIQPEETARLLLGLMQGMRVLGKTGRSRAEMDAFAESALRLLG
jgi:TetR/AcrR family transcriptional regulator, transcriptional repressor for nem operon